MLYRLFIAAELSEPACAELAAVQSRLQRGNPPVRWVAPEALHLTLRFLGDTDSALLAGIDAAMRTAAGGAGAIELRLAGLGAFPSLQRPQVLWAGVAGATAALEQLAARIEQALRAAGLPGEQRPFRAHLTLGRVRRAAPAAALAQLAAAIRTHPPLAEVAWPIERIVLLRSELLPQGPRYTALATAQLSAPIAILNGS